MNAENCLEPVIAVDRRGRRIAYFDGFIMLREYMGYTSEPEALAVAHEWFKTRTIQVPQVVYPFVRRLVFS